MSYSQTLYHSIDEVPAADWRSLQNGDSDPLMEPGFIRAVEKSLAKSGKFWYVIYRDDQGKPVASACLCAFLVDITLLAEGWSRKVATFVGRVVPPLVTLKMLFCGLPISAGQSSLRFAPEADSAAVLGLLDKLLRKLAGQVWAHAIIFKEFDTEECMRLGALKDLGYLRADSPPMNHANPDYADFEDYVAKLPSRKRYPIRKAQKKFAQSGLRVVQMKGGEGADRIYTKEVHQLYENVLEKAAIKLERLTPEFFQEMARQMPDSTAFTYVYQGDKVVAFAASTFTKTVFHQMFVGVDHKLNPECDLYFNLFFNAVDFGLKLRVTEMAVGQTADAFKVQKLGCKPRERYFFVKGANPISHFIVRKGFNVLFPPRYGVLPKPADAEADEAPQQSPA